MKIEMKTYNSNAAILQNIMRKKPDLSRINVVSVTMGQLSAHMEDPFTLYLLVEADRVYFMGQDVGYFKSDKDYSIDEGRVALLRLQARQRGLLA